MKKSLDKSKKKSQKIKTKNLDRSTEATGVPTATSPSAPLLVLPAFTHWYQIQNTLVQTLYFEYSILNTEFQILASNTKYSTLNTEF